MRIAQLRQGDHQKEVAQLFPGKTISGGTWITIWISGRTSLGEDFRPTGRFYPGGKGYFDYAKLQSRSELKCAFSWLDVDGRQGSLTGREFSLRKL